MRVLSPLELNYTNSSKHFFHKLFTCRHKNVQWCLMATLARKLCLVKTSRANRNEVYVTIKKMICLLFLFKVSSFLV